MATTPPPATSAASSSTPATPKRKAKTPTSPKTTTTPKTHGTLNTESPPATPDSPSTPAPRKLTPAMQKTILALKMRGISTKEIATRIGMKYKTVWGFIDKTTKRKAKFGTEGVPNPEEMTESDKKDAALVLKLSGYSTVDIATLLDIKYKTLWGFFNQQQKAAGLPGLTQDPEL